MPFASANIIEGKPTQQARIHQCDALLFWRPKWEQIGAYCGGVGI